jgi:hypothetical protein
MLIENIQAAWISYKNEIINAYANCNRSTFSPNLIRLNFPYDPAYSEELNCIVKGVDYTISSDHPLKICFTTKVNSSPSPINNYTRLPYSIDRSCPDRPLLAYTGEGKEVTVKDEGALSKGEIRFLKDDLIQCSPDLIGKTINISCSIKIKRWVNDLPQKITERIHCYLASPQWCQVLTGNLILQPHVNLNQSDRIVILDSLISIKKTAI